MSDRLRAFLAVALPDTARACAAEAIERLRRVAPGAVRWVPPENQHLTLKFLGEIPEDRVGARGAAALAKLARRLDSAARVVGAERERRPFAAHLTLGRLREPARIEIERLEPPESVAWTVAEVILYESRLAPDGARHVPLAHLALGAGLDPTQNEFAPES